MAEDFSALTHSPQIACLQGLRSADLVVLILGSRYGSVQGSSGVSPTHEEYLEARSTKPILMFVQEGIEREPQQAKFISDVQSWRDGHFRAGFKTANELRDLVTRAIHEYQLSNVTGPLDSKVLIQSAAELLPRADRHNHSGSPTLNVAVVAGPLQRILRPAELEAPSLVDDLHQQALFSRKRLFDRSKGIDTGIEGAALFLAQEEKGARIQLDEHGSLLLRLPLERTGGNGRSGYSGLFGIIEEHVVRELAVAIAFADWTLERIDPTQRLTHIALAARLDASDHLGWRTQAEQDASPNSGTMGWGGDVAKPAIHIDRPRAALRFQATLLAEDLMVALRRQWKSRNS